MVVSLLSKVLLELGGVLKIGNDIVIHRWRRSLVGCVPLILFLNRFWRRSESEDGQDVVDDVVWRGWSVIDWQQHNIKAAAI